MLTEFEMKYLKTVEEEAMDGSNIAKKLSIAYESYKTFLKYGIKSVLKDEKKYFTNCLNTWKELRT